MPGLQQLPSDLARLTRARKPQAICEATLTARSRYRNYMVLWCRTSRSPSSRRRSHLDRAAKGSKRPARQAAAARSSSSSSSGAATAERRAPSKPQPRAPALNSWCGALAGEVRAYRHNPGWFVLRAAIESPPAAHRPSQFKSKMRAAAHLISRQAFHARTILYNSYLIKYS